MIYQTNIIDKLNPIIDDLVNECISQRDNLVLALGNNFPFKTKHYDILYNEFKDFCKKKLNTFTVKEETGCYCYLSDNHFNKTSWHSHKDTANIVGVIYLKVPQNNKGIAFYLNKKIILKKIKEGDLLIFPGDLHHYPYPAEKNELRISINLELVCLEKTKDIFK